MDINQRASNWLPGALLVIFVLSASVARADENALAGIPQNDVIFGEPARNGWEGLPLGNGTLGAQAWTPNGLTFQLNTPWGGALGQSIAQIRLLTEPGLLDDVIHFKQRLSLLTATLETDVETGTGSVRIKSWIAAGADVLVIEVDDRRSGEIATCVKIATWHPTAKHEIRPDRLLMLDRPASRPDEAYPFALAVGAAEGTKVQAKSIGAESSELEVSAKAYTIFVAFADARDAKVDVGGMAQTLLDRCRKDGVARLRAEHEAWWAKFWSRSYIQLTGADSVPAYLANLWYMHIYAMACGSRGDVALKFNGGLWTFDKDQREWGSGYWHWNTQEMYWPLYAADHFDLLESYYKMYFAMLPRIEQQTKDFFGAEGAHFAETIDWNGGDQTGKGAPLSGIHPRLRVATADGAVSMILSTSAEIAMQFWWRFLYTGDREFLAAKAYPLMRSVANFYVAYLEKDVNGHYFMYPSNAHETFWRVKNPATDMAAMRYLFPTIIKASTILGVDTEQRAVWQDRFDHLAPWLIDPKTQGIANYEPRPGEKVELSNAENPNVFPIGVFPVIKLGSPDLDLGIRTFQGRIHVNTYGWTTDSVAAARLGLRNDLEKLLPGHVQLYQDHPSGLMDYFFRKPAIHAYLEASGVFSTGLEEMLLQSWPENSGATEPIIRLCPALPNTWDARYKLLAIGGFQVECVAEKGQPRTATITSTRGGTARVANSFGKEAIIVDGQREVLRSADSILTFPTEAGHVYTLSTAGETPGKIGPLVHAANDAAKQLMPGSTVWLGKQSSDITRWKPPVETNAPRPPDVPRTVERSANPSIAPVRFAAPPALDGELDDDCWKLAAPLGPFTIAGQQTSARQQTEVRVGYDDSNLYLGITCWESHMERLRAEFDSKLNNRDEEVFGDDSVSVMIQPFAGSRWFLSTNALNAIYDARIIDGGERRSLYNLENCRVAGSLKSNRWLVEIAIPWNSLSPQAPKAGGTWGFNVGRNERPSKEMSTWAPQTAKELRATEQLGRLVFTKDIGSERPGLDLPDLIGCWSGESVAGQWVGDRSGHAHHACAVGKLQSVPGKHGQAIDLTGGYLLVDDADELDLAGAYSTSVWVKPTAIGSMRIFDKGKAGVSDSYMLDTHPANNIRYLAQSIGMSRTEVLPQGEWSHLATTFDKNMARLYLNGKLLQEQQGILQNPVPNTLALRIGADSDGASRFQGLMEDLRIYRRPLTPQEITVLSQ